MGYDLHITRRADWSQDESGPPIRLAEWLAYVVTDPDVMTDPDNGPTDFLCTAGSEHPWPIWYHGGELTTKNPSDSAVAKLIRISARLNARVLGDEGEVYPPSPRTALPHRMSWFRRFLCRPTSR